MDSGKREVFSFRGKSIVSDSCTGPWTCDFLVRIPLMTPAGHMYLFFADLKVVRLRFALLFGYWENMRESV